MRYQTFVKGLVCVLLPTNNVTFIRPSHAVAITQVKIMEMDYLMRSQGPGAKVHAWPIFIQAINIA